MKECIERIYESFSEQLRQTPQQAKWHEEGDVDVHTRMVCDALRSLPEFAELTPKKQEILSAAALLHDIGKIPTTRDIAGNIESPRHAPIGSRMARERMWRERLCGAPDLIAERETICQLIRYHSFPPNAIDARDALLRLHRIASVSGQLPDFSLRRLCLLAKADMLGRICDDREQVIYQVDLCEEMAAEEGCLDGCYPFPSKHTMHAYLSGQGVWKDQELFDDSWGPVYLMSGLPGTGKDTWIRRNLPDIPMISLDEIRKERKVSPTGNQGLVANIAKERAREYLRRHEPFVWNATNITQAMRLQLVSLFESYKASVRIIYLETDRDTLLARNSSREEAVPQAAIETMLLKLELPEPFEATRVEWISI